MSKPNEISLGELFGEEYTESYFYEDYVPENFEHIENKLSDYDEGCWCITWIFKDTNTGKFYSIDVWEDSWNGQFDEPVAIEVVPSQEMVTVYKAV